MKFVSYDIVFQEIPDEVTLTINISACPNRCKGCHSPHLQENTGEVLNESVLSALLEQYGNAITCLCFMGGDGEPEKVLRLAKWVRCRRGAINRAPTPEIKTAWYSGKPDLFADAEKHFDYIKLGRYVEYLGGLDSPTTNQRLYKIENEKMIDITNKIK